MSNSSNLTKAPGFQWETPFTILHVETHLIFGPIARHVSLVWILLFTGIVNLLLAFFRYMGKPVAQNLGSIGDKLIFLIIVSFFLFKLKLTRRQQAIVGWISVKATVGITAFIMLTVGAPVSFQRGQADALPILFLGLIWLPGIEFIPKVTPHQRYLTLARIALSIPCIYLGIKSGNWH